MTATSILASLRVRLQRLLRGRIQRAEDAEDVIQAAFLRLQAYYQKGGEVREPEAFLVRTALRLSINAHRDVRRRLHAEAGMLVMEDEVASPGPDELLAAEQSLRQMEQTLERLSEPTREAFLLHRVEGLSYTQIASLCGTTPKAVERRIARAMLALSQLDDQEEIT